MSPGEFYSAVYSKAIELGANDVQARLAASQASEETGFGKSMVGGNLFGIKAGSNYTGPSVTASTEEEYNGNTVRENANFRAYDNFTDSVKDYLGMIQSNFPDAWSAPTFSDAVAGLQTGVYGSYATRAAYPQHITAIDQKYGGFQYAQNPANVPTPYSPSAYADLTGLPNDVIPVDDPNFVGLDPEFAFAQNPANIPAPEARPNVPLGGGLLTALQDDTPSQTPFDSVMSPPNEWGIINGVAPALTPTFNQWDQVASAPPVQSPMGSVTATGLLGANPELAAQATVNPMLSAPAAGLLGTTPGFEASTAVRGLPEVATVSSRMGLAEPGFDQSRFDGNPVSIATDFDPGRFASPSTTAFDASRFGPPSIDVATNTQSFMDQPAAPANLGSFPDAYAAQRGPSTGLLSAEMGQRIADVQRQLLNPSLQAPSVQPSYDVAATGLLGGTAPLSAQATVPSLAGQMTPSQIGGYQQFAQSAPNITNLSGTTGIWDDGTAYQNAVPADLTQTTVVDQPTVVDQNATVDGPATTPALEQQEQATTTSTSTTPQTTTQTTTETAAKPSLTSRISEAVNPGTVTGGLLGGLAAGPVGGILGGLLGNSVYNNGGVSGLLGPGFSAPTTQLPGGMANIASIYGGMQAPGTYSIASNGATITAQPGGWSTYTNAYGVTNAVGPDGKIAAYFEGGATPDDEAESSGGLFGGLFG